MGAPLVRVVVVAVIVAVVVVVVVVVGRLRRTQRELRASQRLARHQPFTLDEFFGRGEPQFVIRCVGGIRGNFAAQRRHPFLPVETAALL